MILKIIKNTFNHRIPITINEFWKQQIWILIVGAAIATPTIILQKNGLSEDIVCCIVVVIFGLIAYIEFIFTVKRYRAINIPVLWACLVFMTPLNLIAFIMAVQDEKEFYMKYWQKFLNIIKEDKNV